MRIRPIHDRILVEMDPLEGMFEGGKLVRPDIALEKPVWGTVRGVGPGKHTRRGSIPTTLKPGDRVLVPWATGHDFAIGGKMHVFVKEFAEADILALQE